MGVGLRRLNPIWDQTRANDGQDRVYEDDGVLIATDFECGNGKSIRQTGTDAYALDLEPEPGEHQFSAKSYYFCFGVRNKRSEPRTVVVNLRNEGLLQWYEQTQHVVTRRGEEWGHLPPEAFRGFPDEERLELTLDLPGADDPAPVLFCSNFHWYPYTELMAWLDELSAADPRVRRSVLGKSFYGRDLVCIEIGSTDPEAPHTVLAQTPQPSEMGQWACRGVLEWLLSDDPQAGAVLERHRVSLLPNTNPDGTVLGYGVSDAQGRFPYFEGDRAAKGDPEALPEIRAVWSHLETVKPWLFIEWHSNNWSRRPGHMLLRYEHDLLGDSARRGLWDEWEERLLRLPNTHHGSWTGYGGLYEPSMGFAAVTHLQSIACMIKHHDKYPHPDILAHAVACFRAAIEVYEAHQP